MPTLNIEARISTLQGVLSKRTDKDAVAEALTKAEGDWSLALEDLQANLSDKALEKVTLAHSLADWSDDNAALVKVLVTTPEVTNVRDVALHFNVDKLAEHIDPAALPETIPGATPEQKRQNFAVALRQKLYVSHPTAVLYRMVDDAEVPIADPAVRAGVAKFLINKPDFDIRTTSVYKAFKNLDDFKEIVEGDRAGVIEQLKTLQRVQAVSSVPEAIPVLINAALTSAFQVSEMPESAFLSAFGSDLGEPVAREVYARSVNNRIRNEHTLMTIHETMRGSGLAIIDGKERREARLAKFQEIADNQAVPLNLEKLFGSMDYCECGECTSVYSAASYFVELLQYLRNNNLEPGNPNTGQSGIKGTPLEKLFRRRPDLGCLELTCENTNTVLPYIDLVNEVMESFVVHLGDYHASTTDPKQAQLEVFNVEDETSSELLAQPQHTNYDAYCILKNAVYPFTLPYHQPIDAIRIFLKYLGTSRYELLDRYRGACEICPDPPLPAPEQQELEALHKTALDRAADSEFLQLTQEEFIILTKEAFWPKRYFDIILKKTHTDDEYRQKIGVKAVYEYYGYGNEADMLSKDEAQKIGLTFVKKQFLPRTGIQYVDLVELLKTQFINPNFPHGKALTILESIRFSYRFLQTLVDTTSHDPKIRFAKLVEFLEITQPWLPLLDALLHPDPCKPQIPDLCTQTKDLRNWVYCYFDRIGKLIVLEAGEGPRLPIHGRVMTRGNAELEIVGTLNDDGTIVDKEGGVIGTVSLTGQVLAPDGQLFAQKFGPFLWILDETDTPIGFINGVGIFGRNERRLNWLPAQDTCNLDKVRLIHLDGTTLTSDEYDRIQRFLRLWRKLEWTIDETDKALIGLANSPSGPVDGTTPDDCHYVGFSDFTDDCIIACHDGDEQDDDCGCPDFPELSCDVTPAFLRQLTAVQKLLDLTGLPLPRLLSLWATISTVGEKSLYKSLFLTHNLLGIDKVFQADKDGNYLTQSAKLTDHIPVLMAALRLKADDIAAIKKFQKLPDALTLPTVSELYRYSVLARILHVKVPQLERVKALFGKPLESAQQTLKLLELWGKMEEAGFTLGQLDYLINNHDDPLRPLAPTQKTILTLAKTLYDGLNAIDRDHPDVRPEEPEKATADLVRGKAGLVFEQTVVERILGLLEGTTIYATNAPANLTLAIPDPLSIKLKYNVQKEAIPPTASIQVKGILTDDEKTQAKGLAADPNWAKAIDRVSKQTVNLFNEFVLNIFISDETQTSDEKDKIKKEAIETLLAGDVNIPVGQQDPAQPDPNTASKKRFYFLKYFLPFMRHELSDRFIVDTMSGAVNVAGETTRVLLADALVAGTPPASAMSLLEKVKEKPAGSAVGWKGYLIPSAKESYTFVVVNDTRPAPFLLDGQAVAFPHQQEDPSDVWSSDAVPLKPGKLYSLEVLDLPISKLQWKTPTAPAAPIPTSALLADYSAPERDEVFTKLYKAALLINGFNLTAAEVSYFQDPAHAMDFADEPRKFDFNEIALGHWRHLQAYSSLRDSLPKAEKTLLDLFGWASQLDDDIKQNRVVPPNEAARLSEQIAEVTKWDQDNIGRLITSKHFDLNRPEAFRNEVNLITLQKAFEVADKIGMEIDRLFDWAKPGSRFWECHKIAEDIRQAIRARYDAEDFEKVIKPLSDQLREDQKQALIGYLLVQQDLVNWGVVDADSLFEFFLIDVQMGDCMETSRIKQAISSVQVFVQRCFLGLEDKISEQSGLQIGVPTDVLDRGRWEWMQRYRVWEANRKVFLYPENWIEPQLRDDKSPFYKELESELLQKDINKQTIEDALKNYLFKVDEVANLRVLGLFLDDEGKKLHIFSRTRNAPYFFYYRYFQTEELNWYPWERMQVDIPNYDVEDATGQILESGAYLIPVVWNRRLLVFFPQFAKKTQPPAGGNVVVGGNIGHLTVPANKPAEMWEIKMGWSEYRNAKWTQKQLTSDAIYDLTIPLPGIHSYEFIPRIGNVVDVDVYRDSPIIGTFRFAGSQLSKEPATGPNKFFDTDFHYNTAVPPEIHSLQAAIGADAALHSAAPFFADSKTKVEVTVPAGSSPITFWHSFAHELIGRLMTGNLDDLFDYYLNTVFTDTSVPPLKEDAFGADTNALYNELRRPYSLYNWEAAFHAPMLIVDRLLKSQQFDQALKICHYVFNPMAKGPDDKRFWQFPPFKEVDAENVLEKLFMGLQPNAPDNTQGSQIEEWRNKPFQPHAIARKRPSAYMKWVAMKYIEILIAYGDYYFRQFTLETLPLAIQCYVLAAHLYGPRGQEIPKRGKIQPQSYNSLLDKWDAFGNAMVELELAFPFSNQTSLPIGISNGVVGLANVFGFATSLYFCIPDNPKLRDLRNTIDDRLFKIRHCQDIEGVFRKLPLFEPPIDPALLVQAAAQGLSLSSVLNDLNSPMPNYRFYYLLQKALELCSEIKALGNAFLSAKEKADAEALSKLRAEHESSIHNLVMEVRKQQLEESQKSLDALVQSRRGPVYRLQHYLKLIGEDLGKVPNDKSDFGELPNQIETPVDEGGLKLSQYEKEEMDKASASADWQTGIGVVETLASIFHALPTIDADAHPLGVGVDVSWGFPNLGNATQAVARGLRIYADHLSFQSSSASRKGGFQRQLQERVQQANTAGYEIKNIDKQILTQQIRINIANQEITNQQKQIDNAQEVEEFLRNKYTNEELYSWMEGEVRTLYYQAYTIAYDLAKRAEKVFRFERGLTSSNFIQFGYWDAGHDGLLSGERLYIGLKQLETAHQEKRGYDYEIARPPFSLRQINPLALIQLKETGACEFALPEILFDMDFPGHYMRRIKSVALTIPCVVGPYTSLNCTLRLLEHKFRTSAIAKTKNDYREKTDETDDRFSTVNVPITAIAVSSGQNDSGVFDLNFRDERYIPFEGAGVISKWRLELPKDFRQFDYDTISDVLLHIRYTAVEGGDKLKHIASDVVNAYVKDIEDLSREEGLFTIFDLQHDFPNEWYKAMHPPADATERVLPLTNLFERLPFFTKGRKPEKVPAVDVYLYTSAALSDSELKLVTDGDPDGLPFGLGDAVGPKLKSFGIKDQTIPMSNWKLKIQDTATALDKLWMVVRFVLK